MGNSTERKLKRTPAVRAVSAWQAQLTRSPVEAAVAAALSCPCVPVVTGAMVIAWGLWAPWASWKVKKKKKSVCLAQVRVYSLSLFVIYCFVKNP